MVFLFHGNCMFLFFGVDFVLFVVELGFVCCLENFFCLFFGVDFVCL